MSDTPKKPKIGYRVTEEQIRGSDPRNGRAREIGNSLRPEGYDYRGCVVIHLYKSPFNSSVMVKTQCCLDNDVPAIEANWALQQGAQAVAKDYGWKKPAIREDALKKEE